MVDPFFNMLVSNINVSFLAERTLGTKKLVLKKEKKKIAQIHGSHFLSQSF